MFEARTFPIIHQKKPKLILNGKFPFSSLIKLGEKGQLDVTVTAINERLEMNEDGNEYKIITFRIDKAEKVDFKGMRL